MFIELRQYQSFPGRRDDLVKYMTEAVIPFQIAKGMVILGSWVGETEPNLYVWIRRFESEAEREQLYHDVYQSDEWKNVIGPKLGESLDRSTIVVTRLEATRKSVLQ